jgi:hypothetical protein
MPKKRYTAEEIIHKLREAEVWLSVTRQLSLDQIEGRIKRGF